MAQLTNQQRMWICIEFAGFFWQIKRFLENKIVIKLFVFVPKSNKEEIRRHIAILLRFIIKTVWEALFVCKKSFSKNNIRHFISYFFPKSRKTSIWYIKLQVRLSSFKYKLLISKINNFSFILPQTKTLFFGAPSTPPCTFPSYRQPPSLYTLLLLLLLLLLL